MCVCVCVCVLCVCLCAARATGQGGDQAALVGEDAVGANEDVAGDGLAEDLDAQHVGDDLLRLAVQVCEAQRKGARGRGSERASERAREGARGREGGREGGRAGGREGGREGGRDIEAERGRDTESEQGLRGAVVGRRAATGARAHPCE